MAIMRNTHIISAVAALLGVLAMLILGTHNGSVEEGAPADSASVARVNPVPERTTSNGGVPVEEEITASVSSVAQVPQSAEPGPHRGRFYSITEAEKLGIRDAFRPADHEWEIEVDNILSGDEEEKVVSQLLSALPRLNGSGQAAAVSHLTNLLGDEDYQPLADVALEQTVGDEALEVIMLDMFNREEEVKLPFFVDLLEKPNHPFHDDAREVLLSVIGHDAPDHDREGWDEAITEWLERTSPDPIGE